MDIYSARPTYARYSPRHWAHPPLPTEYFKLSGDFNLVRLQDPAGFGCIFHKYVDSSLNFEVTPYIPSMLIPALPKASPTFAGEPGLSSKIRGRYFDMFIVL